MSAEMCVQTTRVSQWGSSRYPSYRVVLLPGRLYERNALHVYSFDIPIPSQFVVNLKDPKLEFQLYDVSRYRSACRVAHVHVPTELCSPSLLQKLPPLSQTFYCDAFSFFRCRLQRTGSWLGAYTRRILSFFQPCPPPLSSSTTTQVSARPRLPLADYPREGSIPSLRTGSSLACQYPPSLCPQFTLPAICLSSCLLGTNAGSVTLCCREGVATLSCTRSSTVQLPPLIPVLWTGPSGNASVYDGMLWTA